jgi:hypothetical protein
MKAAILLPLAALTLLAGCATQTPPPPAAGPGPAGQPKMQEALAQLQTAKSDLAAATANKGGHRVRAMELVDQAINQIQMGMAYSSNH